ncbi:NAD(P)-dependent oxidoreductase [uncultured Clostridium sp.]|uniref:NAD(P)-dependent oxidoreductase n=1 Tax=uncultured Clostridium sp. TaxID=59620 RepID=UPI00260E62A7|nr:NAD(P)-dependent oxidoreductase [uncultured Clostridium sp.]
MKDWTGNSKSIYTTMGASNHSDKERQSEDYYATEPKATQLLLEVEQFSPVIWECACGGGHLAQVLENNGYEVIATDLIYRGYGDKESLNFLEETLDEFEGDIITNPPYKYALEFVQKALDSVQVGRKVAMFLKLQFLEGKARKQFFLENPPKVVYVSSSRLNCAMNGDFDKYESSAIAYAWFVWEKGFKGDPIIKWIN